MLVLKNHKETWWNDVYNGKERKGTGAYKLARTQNRYNKIIFY